MPFLFAGGKITVFYTRFYRISVIFNLFARFYCYNPESIRKFVQFDSFFLSLNYKSNLIDECIDSDKKC